MCFATTARPATSSLSRLWLAYNESHRVDRWLEYAKHYERHFPTRGSGPLRMLEIGVQSGGSARLWKQWYGADLTYVGVDVDERCKRTESPSEHIFVEIGSQLDPSFLRSVCATHGPFDMVIDDGGHTAEMMRVSLATIFPDDACVKTKAMYVIEDMAVMRWCRDGYCGGPRDIYDQIGLGFYGMHEHWQPKSRGKTGLRAHTRARDLPDLPEPSLPPWAKYVRSMSLYDSMAFLERGRPINHLTRLVRGRDGFPNKERLLNSPRAYTPSAVLSGQPRHPSTRENRTQNGVQEENVLA